MYTYLLQSCLTLCNSVDSNPPCPSIHGILQARILDWVAIPSSSGSSQPSEESAGRFFTLESLRKPTPFRYDLNQIPYYYTVDMMNRLKGLDLVDRVPKELWAEVHNIV